MRRPQRLRSRRDFSAVHRGRRPLRSALLLLRVLQNGRAVSRFGFTVSGALGNAVTRNRVKRRLRAAVQSLDVAPGWDLVITARPAAAGVSFDQLRSSVAELMDRAGVQLGSGEGSGE